MNNYFRITILRILKLLTLVVICTCFTLFYTKYSSYNAALTIELSDLRIRTYLGVVLFSLIIFFGFLLIIVSFVTSILNSIFAIKERYRRQKMYSSLNRLIESAIMIGIGDKKHAQSLIDEIDKKYLEQNLMQYLDLVQSIASSDSTPVSLYYCNKFPALQKQVAKKLSEIEFKLRNFTKALEYAKEYYQINPSDEKINILLAKIYASKHQWTEAHNIISSFSNNSSSAESHNIFSAIYTDAAKFSLSNQMNTDAQEFAIKALQENPNNLLAAELFAEISTLQRNYKLSTEVLISCFGQKPNFDLVLIIRKFTNLTNLELYDALIEVSDLNSNIPVFLAITSYLNLSDQQKEILDLIQ